MWWGEEVYLYGAKALNNYVLRNSCEIMKFSCQQFCTHIHFLEIRVHSLLCVAPGRGRPRG